MSQQRINNILIGIQLFLEGYTYFICYNIISHLIGIHDGSLPFWMTLMTLVWSFLLSFVVQTINFSLNVRGVLGLISGGFSILILASMHHNLNPFQVSELFNEDWINTAQYIVSLTFLTILWWRGGMLARDETTLDSIRNAFQIGILIITFGLLISMFTSWTISSYPYILFFFSAGLAGLSLARFSGQPSDYQISLKSWLIPICSSVAIVILVGLIIAGLGISGIDESLRFLLKLLGGLAEWLLRPLLLGLGFIASGLIIFGTWLSNLFGGGNLDGLEFALGHTQDLYESLDESREDNSNRFLITCLKIAALCSFGIVSGWCLFKVFRFKRHWSNQSQSETSRESFLTTKLISNDIKSMLHHVLNKAIPLPNNRRSYIRDPKNAREVYYQFLILTKELGHPRNPWQSPKEHQTNLADLLPIEPVTKIVSEFQDVHYGNPYLEISDMDTLLHNWHIVLNHIDTR